MLMSNSRTDMDDTVPSMNEMDCPMMTKRIGRTTYEVSYHFSTTSTETMNEKIKRMIRRDMNI